MENQSILHIPLPLLTEIIPKYKGIYSPQTIEIIYRYLKERLNTLGPIVRDNERQPLVTAKEREGWKNEEAKLLIDQIAQRSNFNISTRRALEDCKEAWNRLINGKAHQCVSCGGTIDNDRKQARPDASRCKKCQEKKGLRVS